MTIFALMIAVADYPDSVPSLLGCGEDLKAVTAFFTDYAQINGVEIKVKSLLNKQATRASVISGFNHFNEAGPDDVCLLYYSGHGSQILVPKEFWDQAPDHKCDTWVLHDSRSTGGCDITSFEISYLLATHTKTGGQVLVISDSCHSGALTRATNMVPRMVAESNAIVRLEDLFGYESYQVFEEYRHPPVRDHILLSACGNGQLAVEMPINGKQYGLFTYHLLEVMKKVNLSEISYAELADRVRVRVKNINRNQNVHSIATGDADIQQYFLNGELKLNRSLTLDFDKQNGWFVPQGEVSGSSVGGKGIILDGETEREIIVKALDVDRSYVNTKTWMSKSNAPYPLIYLDDDKALLTIYLSDKLSDKIMIAQLTNAIEDTKGKIGLTDDPNAAKYHVSNSKEHGIFISLPRAEVPLFEGVHKSFGGWAEEFIRKVSQVAVYEHVLQLAPINRVLDLNPVVEIKLEQIFTDINGEELVAQNKEQPTDGTAVFSYTRDEEGGMVQPLLRLSLRVKKGEGPFYVGMLYLDEMFSVSKTAMPMKRLSDKDGPYVTKMTGVDEDGQYYTNYIGLILPDELQNWGFTEITNYLKVIVSKSEFSFSEFEQPGISLQEIVNSRDTLRRGILIEQKIKKYRASWGTKSIPITIFRPLKISDTIKKWSLDGKLLESFGGHKASITSLSVANNLVLSTDSRGNYKVYENGESSVAGGDPSVTASTATFLPEVTENENSSVQAYLIGYKEGSIRTYKLQGKVLKESNLKSGPVNSLAFHPSDKNILVGTNENNAKLYNEGGKHLLTLGGPDYLSQIGPFGSEVGEVFFKLLPPGARLTSLIITSSKSIEKITMKYQKGKQEGKIVVGDSNSQANEEFYINALITKITGRAGERLHQMQFHFADGSKTRPYGSPEGTPFVVMFDDMEFVGIFGRIGNRIGELGFFGKPQNKSAR